MQRPDWTLYWRRSKTRVIFGRYLKTLLNATIKRQYDSG